MAAGVPERWQWLGAAVLAVFGSAPLVFYILHLYVAHLGDRAVGLIQGAAGLVSVESVWAIWLVAALVALPCRFACRRFAIVRRSSDQWWMRDL